MNFDKGMIEDWHHIWRCESNETDIDTIIKELIYTFETKLIDENNNEEVELLREINFDFIRIIEQPSVILKGMNRAWEIVRGVYNANFNNLSNKKEGKKIVKKLWNFIYEEIKKRIWIKRCEDIAEIEKKEGIEKKTLKKRKTRDF